MANEESNKFSSNLKVPPLKIVLSVHQNNTVVNMGNLEEEDPLKSNMRDDNSNDHTDHESGRRNGSVDDADSSAGDASGKQHRKNSKTNSTDRGNDNTNNESGQLSATRTTTVYSSSSSSSSSSDRSNSTTPSSESESLASNSTIISEHHLNQQQQQVKNKGETKDETCASGSAGSASSNNKQERLSRIGSRGTTSEKSSEKSSNKRVQDGGNADNSGDSTATNSCSKEHSLNANQRITRSSQRAAQQNKIENPGDQNGEELNIVENHEKALESVRKVKRRKGEIQESEQEASQSAQQLTVAMANIYPADYQIPSQNSFELYRDIRKRPYKKLMKLSHIQPKVPHGFKDYLINGGPYLLEGNRLGAGLSGPRLDGFIGNRETKLGTNSPSRPPTTLKMRYTTPQKRAWLHPANQRHTSYTIPMISEAPRALQVGSPLYELFQDQEKARHQMRMQHLKERERAIMAAEQEILRAYNRAAIANNKQKLHLSACTYFYYQERYHYIDEKSGPDGQKESKEVPHSQDNSFLCIEGGESASKTADNNNVPSKDSKNSSTDKSRKGDGKCSKDEKKLPSTNSSEGNQTKGQDVKQQVEEVEVSTNGNKSKTVSKGVQLDTNGSKQTSTSCSDDNVITKASKDSTESASANCKEGQGVVESNNKNDDQVKNVRLNSDNDAEGSSADAKIDPKDETISDEDLKISNKEVFITQLQDIDDKWDKIKRDMLVRHKNEADSLYAVQSLEWEWKAKEIGVCDVRVSLKVEPEFVPRVDVAALDY